MKSDLNEVLFLAASSGDGQFRYLVDPELKRRLLAAGIRCSSCFINQLTRAHLEEADTVVLMRFPLIGHSRNDHPVLQEKTSWLYNYVECGGNLVLMFAESYGRSEAAMNEFTAGFDISFAFNRIEEQNPERQSMMPFLDCGRLISCDIDPVLPELKGITILDLIVDGGHGTQHLTCQTGEAWIPFLRGSATCSSMPFPQGFYGGGGKAVQSAPIFGAYRRYGQGQVLAFPGSSPLWVANAFLPRWKGTLMTQHNGSGFKFLVALFNHRHSNRTNHGETAALQELDAAAVANREFSFRYASDAERERLHKMNIYRLWIGTIPEGRTVEEVLADAIHSGFTAAVIVYDWYQLSPEIWRQRREELARVNCIIAVPGYEQIDAEGNASVVFNVNELPDQRLSYPNSNLLEDLLVKINGYSAVYARLSENRLPYWRNGGYNLLEISNDYDVRIFRELVSSCGFIGGVNISRGEMPSASKKMTLLLAEKPSAWHEAVSENLHLSQITTGPRLRLFDFPDVKLIIDDWEGYWYEWETGQHCTLKFELEADYPLTEVCLWDGMKLLQRFSPDSNSFIQEISMILEHDVHLHVTAKDAAGGELCCSWPLHTRNRYYWAHRGSDQMNDYHNVFELNQDGFLGIGDNYYEPYGFVTCGYAWGDYVRITPPVPWSDIIPSGIEVSSMVGNFKSFHPSPFLSLPSGFDFLNNHFRRLGTCKQDLHLVYSDASSTWINRPGATWVGHGGRTFIPTRSIMPSSLWCCSAVYSIPKWCKYQPCSVNIDLEITWLRNVGLAECQTISLAHSMHQWNDTLRLAGGNIALTELLHPGHQDSFSGEKEWDTLGVLPLLQMPVDAQPGIPIESDSPIGLTGDPAATYFFTLDQAPGEMFLRGWHWKNGCFVLSYELNPMQKSFRTGDKLRVNYHFSCGAGEISGRVENI